MNTTSTYADELDRRDPIEEYRSRFHIPKQGGKELVYFCGNSLGLQPKSLKDAVIRILDQWKDDGVEGWFKGKSPWISMHREIAASLAKVVGANSSEVAIMNTLSVNLHLLMASFFHPEGNRTKILMEKDAFPSDHHIVNSQLLWHRLDPQEHIIYLSPDPDEAIIRNEHIIECIQIHKDELALVLLGGISYYSGQFLNIPKIVEFCKSNNIVVGFDLAHAAGNVMMKLHEWGVDFAAWCTYKYLNSGPGGPGAIFIHDDLSSINPFRLKGWWGHEEETRFLMKPEHIPMSGASGWQVSTPQILNFVGLQESLKIFEDAGMESIETKRMQMNDYLDFLLESLKAKGKEIKVITPQLSHERGAQISLVVQKNARVVFDKLIDRGIIGDWREPDVIRLSPAPLYNTFKEIHKVYQTLMEIL
ncbi:MAG: kynureninase [Bacteroidia bacterium]|nr:kynureninase [Bacteroidia bacterium]